MLANLVRKLFPPKPTVDPQFADSLKDNHVYAVTSKRESQRELRAIEAVKERLPVATGNLLSDLYRGVNTDERA